MKLLKPFRGVCRIIWYRLVPDKIFLKIKFRKIFGFKLDLKHPKTLNEKFQWLKLNDRTPLHTQCADKYAVRDYVREKIGEKYLVPLILTADNVNEIKEENMPDYPFIIKTNHNSGGYFVVYDKKKINWKEIRKLCQKWLKENFYYRGKEWQYKNIKPLVLVEKLLLDDNRQIPNDYKLMCFNGKVAVIQEHANRKTDQYQLSMFDRDWNLLPFSWTTHPTPSLKLPKKPVCLEEMITIAEIFAKDFVCVRVDLYEVGGKIYFGELTFHDGSGFDKITPLEWDYKLGEMLKLPID